MKISILLPDLRGGGAERLHLELAREFRALGHDVEFLLMSAQGDLLEEAEQEFAITDLQAQRIRQLPWLLIRHLRRHPPNALLAAMWPMTAIAVAAVQFSRAPTQLIVSEHVDFRMTPTLRDVERKILRYFGSAIYRRAGGIVAVSEGVADSLVKTSGLKRSDISVIHNPVRSMISEGLPSRDREILRPWLGAERRLIAIGNLKRQKGFDTLIDAMHRLHVAQQNVSLLILGEGGLRQDLEAQVARLDLEDSILMPGFRSNPAPYLEQADLFVLSSDWEGFGNVIVEALSMGVPVVSTDCPSGPAEILAGGRYGRLVPPRDPESLAKAIGLALAHTADRDTLIARAGDFAVEHAAIRYLELLSGAGK